MFLNKDQQSPYGANLNAWNYQVRSDISIDVTIYVTDWIVLS